MKARTRVLCSLFFSIFFFSAGCFEKGKPASNPGGGGNPTAGPPAPSGPTGPVLPGPSRSSAAALSPDESVLVVCNRDSGSVTIFGLAYTPGQAPKMTGSTTIDLGAGSEPWQAAVDPNGDTAYVVLRRAQRLVRIDQLHSAPKLSSSQAVLGSEPTSLALTPHGTYALVANWVDGTLSVVTTATMSNAMPPIDLNGAIASRLGLAASRPALAHPSAVAITNHGGILDDLKESVYVTEFFSFRKVPENPDGSNADTSQKGLVYKVDLTTGAAIGIELSPLGDMGFKVKEAGGIVSAACYPNQLQSITINGGFAFVLSVCASPKGPIGPVFPQASGANIACPNGVSDCASLGLAEAACVVPQAGSPAACVDLGAVKTATAPLVSVIDLTANQEIPSGPTSLNAQFKTYFDSKSLADDNSRRFPLIPDDLTFVAGKTVGYVSANGADAVYRVVFDPATGAVTEVGTKESQPFIDLTPTGIAATSAGRGPIAVATGSQGFAFTANDITRNVSVLDLNTQTVSGGAGAPLTFPSASLPVAGSAQDTVLQGKKFFNTGTGRWSLRAQAWNSCQSCHPNGLTDNVTWYFARGPRQATSLDGTFSKKNPNSDQRILNWTAILDEIADFEGNVRGVSGGVGATVSSATAPLTTAQRINLGAVPLLAGGTINDSGLSGSAFEAANPSPGNPTGVAGGVLTNWQSITEFIKTIRSPRAPSNLDTGRVAAGRAIYQSASCQGCHSGDKWTISNLFYDPKATVGAGTLITDALKTKSWEAAVAAAGFPSALLPATPGNGTMRFNGTNPAAFDQLVCILRPVGTFATAESGVAVNGKFPELRADMATASQGNQPTGNGYNPPSLLGLATGAPYLHHGGARTLEALFSPAFSGHHQALSPNFQPTGDQLSDLVQFLLSIDQDTPAMSIPTVGPQGGNFCATP